MLYRIACCDDEQQILDRLKECFVRLEVQTDIETQVDYYTWRCHLFQECRWQNRCAGSTVKLLLSF